LLAHLAAALLRTDGVPAFVRTLSIASQWLTEYWPGVYPVVDQDAMTRRNALNCLADPMAVIDALRRAPLVASRQHGKVGVRDVEIATGAQQPVAGEPRIGDAEIKAAFAEAPLDDLVVLQESVTGGLASLKQIETTMLTQGGSGAVPEFDPLSAQLAKIDRVLREHVASRAPAAANAESAAMATQGGEVVAVGNIRSRQDAIRALEAAAEFFRRNEPSSPVPLLIDRAKRLVSKNFLEVLADVAPDGLSQARSVSGISNGE
jgi:type VI secretion system protein ImpA